LLFLLAQLRQQMSNILLLQVVEVEPVLQTVAARAAALVVIVPPLDFLLLLALHIP
jgi:hypothetical protein